MSQENIEIVQEALNAFGRNGVDGMAEYWTDDIDHRAVEGAIDDWGPIHGKDAMHAYAQDWLETFDDFKIEPVELIDAGADRVLAVLRAEGRAKLSGVETNMSYAVVYGIRDRKIAWGREYLTREEALEAAGLRE
jgi:ketosteroid isomerase-like protein